MHYVDDWKLKEKFIALSHFAGAHDGDKIYKWTVQKLKEMELFPRYTHITITTDRGANIRKAFNLNEDELRRYADDVTPCEFDWYPCAAHTLSNCVKVGINGVRGEQGTWA